MVLVGAQLDEREEFGEGAEVGGRAVAKEITVAARSRKGPCLR